MPATWKQLAYAADVLPGLLSPYAVGDLLYANSTTTLAKLADVAVGSYLKSGGVGAVPAWATLNQAAVAGLTTADGPSFAHLHLADVAAIYTAAESWVGPSSTAGVYFKGGFVGIGTTVPLSKLNLQDGDFSISGASIAHPMTDYANTKISFMFFTNTTYGGATLRTFTSIDLSTSTLTLDAFCGIAGALTYPPMRFRTGKYDGSIGVVALAATDPAFQFLNYTTPLVSMWGNGHVGIGTVNPGDVLNVSGLAASIQLNTYGSGNQGLFLTFHARGTESSPTATQLNDRLGGFAVKGYGASGFSSAARGQMAYYAAENWTDTAQGTYFSLYTTPIGSATRAEVLRVTDVGNVGIGTTDPSWPLEILNAAAANDADYIIAGLRAGTDVTLGLLNLLFRIHPSATAANRYISIESGDSVGVRTFILQPIGGNVHIGGSVNRATNMGDKVLNIFDATAPTGTLANGCSIYSAAGELYTMDAAGNATLQTPHDDNGLWVFDSIHTVTGKRLRIDMEKMMRFLNDRFGTDFVHDFKLAA